MSQSDTVVTESSQEAEAWGSALSFYTEIWTWRRKLQLLHRGIFCWEILCLLFLYFFSCWCCSTLYKILKYSLSQREQLYITVFRLCSREAGHRSHEYFNIVNKVEHILLKVLIKQPFFCLPPALGDTWWLRALPGKLGSDLHRQMRKPKPYFQHFKWIPLPGELLKERGQVAPKSSNLSFNISFSFLPLSFKNDKWIWAIETALSPPKCHFGA